MYSKMKELFTDEMVVIKVIIIKKLMRTFIAILECQTINYRKILQEGSLSIGCYLHAEFLIECFDITTLVAKVRVLRNLKPLRYILNITYLVRLNQIVIAKYFNLETVILIIQCTIYKNVQSIKNILMHKT